MNKKKSNQQIKPQPKQILETNSVPIINTEQLLKTICIVILIGLVCACFFNFYYQGIILNEGYPYNTFLFLKSDRYNDFFGMVKLCKNSNPYFDAFYLGNSNYLPIANSIFWLYSFLPKNISLILYIGSFSTLLFLLNYKLLPNTLPKIKKYMYTFILTFLTYAYLICVDRANLEPYVAILILAFFYFYLKNNNNISIIFLALAAATKIYPILFILLFISDKNYKAFAYTIFYTIIFVFIPLYFQKEGYVNNMNYILNGFELDINTASFVSAFEDKGNLMIQGLSLFCGLKILNIQYNLELTNMLNKYFIFVGIYAMFVIFYATFIEKTLWKKVTLYTTMILILPHMSFDYKLIHIVLCVILFLKEYDQNNQTIKNPKLIAILFAFILIPKAFYYFPDIITTTSGQNDVSIGTILNPLLMLLLSIIIIKGGLKGINKTTLKDIIADNINAIKLNLKYVLPLILLLIPFFILSKNAKAEYSNYKKYYLNAQSLLANNKKQEALQDFKKSYELKPFKFKIPLQIATIYTDLGKIDSAQLYYNKLLQKFPNCEEGINGKLILNINQNFKLAQENVSIKNYENAINLFDTVLTQLNIIPNSSNNQNFIETIYANKCVCAVNTKNWKLLNENLILLEKLNPNNEFLKTNKNSLLNLMANNK